MKTKPDTEESEERFRDVISECDVTCTLDSVVDMTSLHLFDGDEEHMGQDEDAFCGEI